jgi:aminodeoxychorismate lyase
MFVYLNSQFVPEAEAKVSVFDRGFLYGDSLFETMRVCNRRIFRWHQHLERLMRGCDYLGMRCPVSAADLRDAARKLVEANQLTDALLRLTLSRGVGPRGYSPAGADSPTLVLASYPSAPIDPANATRWQMITSSFRLPPADRLASHKTGNKLLQVLARREAESAEADEALLVNTQGEVAEGASANLFWTRGPVIYTSPTAVGVLPGVTRAVILEICAAMGLAVKKRLTKVDLLLGSDALFLTNSVQGVIEVVSLDGHVFLGSPIVERLRQAFSEVMRKECGVSTGASPEPLLEAQGAELPSDNPP